MKDRKVKIGRKTYRIRLVERVDEEDSYGECDYTGQLIKIKIDQSKAEMANTILHELLHAICDEKHLGLKRDLEEEIVTELANGLHEFLMKNRAYGKKLTDMLRQPHKPLHESSNSDSN